MARAKLLLLTTGEKGSVIATLCGFSSPYHFYNRLKTATGLTVREFRRQNAGL